MYSPSIQFDEVNRILLYGTTQEMESLLNDTYLNLLDIPQVQEIIFRTVQSHRDDMASIVIPKLVSYIDYNLYAAIIIQAMDEQDPISVSLLLRYNPYDLSFLSSALREFSSGTPDNSMYSIPN